MAIPGPAELPEVNKRGKLGFVYVWDQGEGWGGAGEGWDGM